MRVAVAFLFILGLVQVAWTAAPIEDVKSTLTGTDGVVIVPLYVSYVSV